jgi:hypothetical protein
MAKKVKLNSLLDDASTEKTAKETIEEQNTFKDKSLVGNG